MEWNESNELFICDRYNINDDKDVLENNNDDGMIDNPHNNSESLLKDMDDNVVVLEIQNKTNIENNDHHDDENHMNIHTYESNNQTEKIHQNINKEFKINYAVFRNLSVVISVYRRQVSSYSYLVFVLLYILCIPNREFIFLIYFVL
jgi:hypothetical protein